MNVGGFFQRQMGRDLSPINSETGHYKSQSDNRVKYWQSYLGLEYWDIICIPISEMQVVDDLTGGLPGNEFVGVCIDQINLKAVIYHTRPLDEDDIIHELLHVRFLEWDEDLIVHWTDKLCRSTDPKSLLSELMFLVA